VVEPSPDTEFGEITGKRIPIAFARIINQLRMIPFLAYFAWAAFQGSGLSRAVTYGSGRWTTPFTVDHGYVLVWDEPGKPSVPLASTVTLYGPDGRERYALPFVFKDQTHAQAVTGIVSANGEAAFAYWSMTPGHQSHGVALVPEDGKSIHVTATDPYVPGPLCFTEDGALWMGGNEGQPITSDFPTVRKLGGDSVSSVMLPVSRVVPLEEAQRLAPFHQTVGGWRMRAAKDRIGVIVDRPGSQQWLEFDFGGTVLGRWDVPHAMEIAAYTEGARVFGQMRDGAVFELNKDTGEWVKTGCKLEAQLVAADGEELVFRMSRGRNRLVWMKLRKR